MERITPKEELTDVTFSLYPSDAAHESMGSVVFEPEDNTFFVVNKVVAPHFFAVLYNEL